MSRLFNRMGSIFILAAFLVLFACEKPEGPGGKGSIRGQVILKTYDNQFRVLQSEVPAADEDVFIIYGEGQTISDDLKTSPDGRFNFQYLSKGDYIVFAYSEDTTGNSESEDVIVGHQINLSSNSHEYDMGRIYIHSTMDVDDGQATISGRVFQVNYSKYFLYILDTTYAQNLDVFLLYEDDLHYTDRVRTLYDGTFAFPYLIKGDYSIFVYSDDTKGGFEKVPVKKQISVEEVRGTYDAGIFYTAKED